MQAKLASLEEQEINELKLSTEKQRVAADKAFAETSRQWAINRQLRADKERVSKETAELRDEITIMKKEFQLLGKRPAQSDPNEEATL